MHILFLILLPSAFAGNMDGGCKSYKTDVSQELKLWEQKPATVTVGEELPVQQKLQYQLKDQKQVAYQVEPEKRFGKGELLFGGTFIFKPEKSGRYQFALGKRAWLDLVDRINGTIIKSGDHDMQTKCDKLVKVMGYNLEAGKNYLIQINGSPTETLDGAITTK